MKVHVTTTIEKEMYEFAEKNGIKFSEALAYGINAKLNRTRIDSDVTELKTSNEKLKVALDRYIPLVKELQERVILLESQSPRDNKG